MFIYICYRYGDRCIVFSIDRLWQRSLLVKDLALFYHSVSIHVCMYVCTCICLYICAFVCMCVCMYVCIVDSCWFCLGNVFYFLFKTDISVCNISQTKGRLDIATHCVYGFTACRQSCQEPVTPSLKVMPDETICCCLWTLHDNEGLYRKHV